jgi:hypothetical protein
MKTFHQPPRAVAIAVAIPRRTPSPWRDLKRDWQRWSPAERLATQCLTGVALAIWALTLAVAWLH